MTKCITFIVKVISLHQRLLDYYAQVRIANPFLNLYLSKNLFLSVAGLNIESKC